MFVVYMRLIVRFNRPESEIRPFGELPVCMQTEEVGSIERAWQQGTNSEIGAN